MGMDKLDRAHIALWLGRLVKQGRAELADVDGVQMIDLHGLQLSDEDAVCMLTNVLKNMEEEAGDIRELLQRVNGKEVTDGATNNKRMAG